MTKQRLNKFVLGTSSFKQMKITIMLTFHILQPKFLQTRKLKLLFVFPIDVLTLL